MDETINIAQKIAHDYQPNYQKTKDMIAELDEVKTELINEMSEIKYLLQ